MRRLAALAAACCAAALAPAASAAGPGAYPPPAGKVFSGVTGSTSLDSFARETADHPAVFGFFTKFFGANEFIFDGAERAGSRLMLHISTQDGYGTREVVTPLGIAKGEGDRYLVGLNRRIAEHGRPTYVRLMAEMNQANNGYSAFDRSGRPRGKAHSTQAFKQAWRRSTLILRGGPVAEIDARLRRLGLPGVPNFHWLEDFYRDFPGKPFVFGEWALWGGDDPAFVQRLFAWIHSHPRVRMAVYNQGAMTNGPFRLNRYPRSRAALRKALAHRRFDVPPAR